MNKLWIYAGFLAALTTATLSAQQPRATQANNDAPVSYELAPGDQIAIRVANAEEFGDRTFRVDSDGFVTVPLAGKVKAAGLTAPQLEADLVMRLKTWFREPAASVTIVQATNAPVFLSGQFRTPGLYPLRPDETLVQILTGSGGLVPNASRQLRLTRRKDQGPIPVDGVQMNIDGSTSILIGMTGLETNVSPARDLVLKPFDVVQVDRADVIYVSGDVNKPGTVDLGDRDSLYLMQVLTLSGGLTKDAGRKVRVLRPIENTARRKEMEIDVDKLYKGQAEDFALLPNDIIFVPRSSTRQALAKTATIATTLGVAVVTSLAIAH